MSREKDDVFFSYKEGVVKETRCLSEEIKEGGPVCFLFRDNARALS